MIVIQELAVAHRIMISQGDVLSSLYNMQHILRSYIRLEFQKDVVNETMR